jgi:hypothetical protein
MYFVFSRIASMGSGSISGIRPDHLSSSTILRSFNARDAPEGKYTFAASDNSGFCTGGIATLDRPANRYDPSGIVALGQNQTSAPGLTRSLNHLSPRI